MSKLAKVHVTHQFTSDPATVFAALSEHENLASIFPARITRVRNGHDSRNGAGSVRRLKIGPLPAFEETVMTAEEPALIEYRITKGSPLKSHRGVQRLTPTADGGTQLDYTIEFAAPVPGLAKVVALALTQSITSGLPKLAP
ncbi:hypothetical protein HMPREF0063_11365 [Aeromicrobium marinum DSM 15272]|uniref:Polyketide cyclase/dehydrase n=1 Tax=Aeromicrobium marinum DSM 15272 TaxID=585531 RepID=E2SBF6_9ACTN|nr:SRPBCC family protein [Aeromicrobium marinum]EFQ83702.1 hypothetical protein HMPREF0063_11365 [Aeromicrobium marinum DSM 15272]